MMVLPSYNRDIFGVYVLGDNGGAIRAIPHPFWCRIPGTRTGTESSTPRDRPMVSAPREFLCGQHPLIPLMYPWEFLFIDIGHGPDKGVVLADIDSDKLSDIAARRSAAQGTCF